ncbi:hypothetical protein Leryth_001995 [Lithospermum erythrorhizon]|nr:hypothetical protein Leryth_001995 [Lithospermum erythrorhizon]
MFLRFGKIFLHLKSVEKYPRATWYVQSCSSSDISNERTKLAPIQERRMIDRFRLVAKGGDGGNGCESFRRSRHARRGVPDGGNGGRGGDVILESSRAVWDFSGLQHHVNAKRGGNGSSKNMIGSRGADKIVQVPVGTAIHLVQGELPSTVEINLSSTLDPWDIPTSMDSEHEPIQHCSNNDCAGSVSEEPTNQCIQSKTNERAPKLKNTNRIKQGQTKPYGVTISKYNSRLEEEVSFVDGENECSSIEEFKTETLTSGSEDELDEEVEMQYDVAELTEPRQRIIIAQGGEGGRGSVALVGTTVSMGKNMNIDSETSDDDVTSQRAGLPGSEILLVLELKSIADVGLVGMPNAGKSTLLGAMSRAKPRVGDYAFTTLRPNLGNLTYDDFSVTVADIPGLITGAHENRGLGHAFLRHIERTKVLAYVLDLAAALDGKKGLPPWKQLRDLITELEFYSEGLSNRPSLVVANKIDEAGAEDVFKELKQRVHGVQIFPVCAVLQEGVPELKAALKKLVGGEESHKLKLDAIVID